jgi:polo-like kinase 1
VCGETKEIFAGKVVDKESLQKMRRRQKMQAEIQLHKQLGNGHPHIVKFHRFFEDEKNVYIILELCSNQTLADLLRRRRSLTEFECRYYSKQIISALKFMHSPENRVLHRDLKLGNLFLDSNLHIKIGDFGLATQL